MIIDKSVYGNEIIVYSLRYSQDILIFSLKNLLNTAIISTIQKVLAKNINNYVSL